ncbi:NAD(P)-dependent alcohol dehydrogenase [Cystobacter ferrugineus]|uniref:NAD(P)-dependent alcohol dehydrogenase n=1 Tax=Cystobacter ferrugineus TaxID=83449 RepID=A0A1L9ATS8_9BACT|nr:NAD(P)-dependent alcohol dehydrogenase [Cystobacter ferrugineus]OJH33382.1 NAD(P)-dependent alcohol dehydrogenase [Cystobacter ferrugineus]
MRTILQSGYGEPERVLVQGESDIPTPGDGEVLVRVHATSVNTPDCLATLGVPYALRPVMGLRAPVSPVRGSDVAGVVEAVGAHVTGFAPGDAVFGSVWTGGYKRGAPGTFCEYTVVPATQLAHKPAKLSFEEAAGAVMSGVTALVAMRDVARVRAGQQVLVNGASGGLGTFAVQLARALGAVVTGVCSTRNVELVRSLGASHVIDYTRTSYPEQDARYDVVMDNVMNHPPSVSARVLTANGVLLPNSIGTHKWLGTLPSMAFGALFKSRQWRTIQFVPSRKNLEDIGALIQSGAVKVVIDKTYPLAQAGKAVAHMASRRARGQIVLSAM